MTLVEARDPIGVHFEFAIAIANGCYPTGSLVGLMQDSQVARFGRAKRAGMQTEDFARARWSVEWIGTARTRASVVDTADGSAVGLWTQEDAGPIAVLCQRRQQVPFGKMDEALGLALQVDLGGRAQLEELQRCETGARAEALHVLPGDGYDVMATATSALIATKGHGRSV